MKPNTPELLKFKKLQRRLSVSIPQLVGHLELLWIATAKNAPQGDIGRFSNEDIAIACCWDGDHDELVAALIECKWLDECPSHRLVVHDWKDHAPTWVIGSLARHRKRVCVADEDFPKEAAKDPAKEAAKEAAKEPAKEARKEVARHAPTSTSTFTSTSPIQSNPIQSIDSSEPSQASEPVDPSIVFDLVGKDSGPWNPPIELLDRLQEYYPNLDVRDQVRRAAAWHACNPTNRKTRNGIAKFLNSWLAKTNDRGANNGAHKPQAKQNVSMDVIKQWRQG